MKEELINFSIPEAILVSLKSGINDIQREIRLIAATKYFSDKRLSLGKAAKFARINRIEFLDHLRKEGLVVFDLDESALSCDLEGLKKLEEIEK